MQICFVLTQSDGRIAGASFAAGQNQNDRGHQQTDSREHFPGRQTKINKNRKFTARKLIRGSIKTKMNEESLKSSNHESNFYFIFFVILFGRNS